MDCLNPACGAVAKFTGQNKKSDNPYIATAYYTCTACFTKFTIHKTEGDITTPTDPDIVLRRVLQDISILPKQHLKLISDNVSALFCE